MARENHVLNNGLTDFAVKAATQGMNITDDVFRRVSINHLEGTYRSYGIDDFRPDDDGPTDLDAPYLRVGFNVGRKQFRVEDYGYYFNITRVELKTADSELRLQMRRQRNLMRRLRLQREIRAKDLILDDSKYPAGHKVSVANEKKWSIKNYDMRQDVENAKLAVRNGCGMKANAMIIGEDLVSAMISNEHLIGSYQAVREGRVDLGVIARQFGIPEENISVGSMMYDDRNEGQIGEAGNLVDDEPNRQEASVVLKDIWADDVVLYVKDDMIPDGEEPEDTVFAASFELDEDIYVTEGPQENPPGTIYVTQWIYGLKINNYRAAYIFKGAK